MRVNEVMDIKATKEMQTHFGEDIKLLQYRWPLGMPLVRKLESEGEKIAMYFPSSSPVSASIPYVTMLIVGLFVTIRLFLLLRIQYTIIAFVNLSPMVYVQYLVVNYSPDSHPSPDVSYPAHLLFKEKRGITHLELSTYFPLLKKGKQGGILSNKSLSIYL